jgi:hypothetical protein
MLTALDCEFAQGFLFPSPWNPTPWTPSSTATRAVVLPLTAPCGVRAQKKICPRVLAGYPACPLLFSGASFSRGKSSSRASMRWYGCLVLFPSSLRGVFFHFPGTHAPLTLKNKHFRAVVKKAGIRFQAAGPGWPGASAW